MNHQRIGVLDYAKGIAMLLVIFGHVLQNTKNGDLSFLLPYIYSFHMAVFFVISGICMRRQFAQNDCIGKRTVSKLTRKFLLAYFVWSGIYYVLSYLLSLWKEDYSFSILKSVVDIVTGRGLSVLWFLLEIYLIEVVYSFLWNKNRVLCENGKLLLIITFFLSLALQVLYTGGIFPSYFTRSIAISVFRFFPGMFFFCCGAYGERYLEQVVASKSMSCKVCLLSSACMAPFVIYIYKANAAFNLHIFKFTSMFVFLVMGVLGTVLLISICSLIDQKVNVLHFVYDNNYYLMLLHCTPIPTIPYLSYILGSAGGNFRWYIQLVIFFITFGVALVLSLVCRKYFRTHAKA